MAGAAGGTTSTTGRADARIARGAGPTARPAGRRPLAGFGLIPALALLLGGCGPTAASVPTYLRHAPDAAFSAQARAAQRTATRHNAGCVVIRRGAHSPLPTPYQRCAESLNGPAQVLYSENWRDQSANPSSVNGLLFRPGGAQPVYPDSCLRRLDGPWWAWMKEGDATNPCAPGFRFVGGP